MDAGRADDILPISESSVVPASLSPVTANKSSSPAAGVECFDCNICLDFAVEPVVTLCGHLYCWPCIYKWLQQRSNALAPTQCPVCKAALSVDALVPLYGRGNTTTKSAPSCIPCRPTVHRDAVQYHNPRPNLESELLYDDGISAYRRMSPWPSHSYQHDNILLSDYRGQLPASASTVHAMAGLGGMAVSVIPWVMRNSPQAALFNGGSQYDAGGNSGSLRLSRRQMELSGSLHQIWFFLFALVVLCLLLF